MLNVVKYESISKWNAAFVVGARILLWYNLLKNNKMLIENV